MLSYLIIQQGTAGNDGPPGPPGERVSATQNALQQTFLSHHIIYSEMVYRLEVLGEGAFAGSAVRISSACGCTPDKRTYHQTCVFIWKLL